MRKSVPDFFLPYRKTNRNPGWVAMGRLTLAIRNLRILLFHAGPDGPFGLHPLGTERHRTTSTFDDLKKPVASSLGLPARIDMPMGISVSEFFSRAG